MAWVIYVLIWYCLDRPQHPLKAFLILGPNYSVLIKGEVSKATHVLIAWLLSSSLRTAPVSFSTLLFMDDSLLRCWGGVTTDDGTQINTIWPGGFRLWKSKAGFAVSTVVHLSMLRLWTDHTLCSYGSKTKGVVSGSWHKMHYSVL